MKGKPFIVASLILVGLAILAILSRPSRTKGHVEVFSQLEDNRLGRLYVLGRYDGLLNGWDVAFFHCDTQRQWVGYYLAHESRGWAKANLQLDGKRVRVNKGHKIVAEYDIESGAFTNRLQFAVYHRREAAVDERGAAFWNLGGIQESK